MSMILTLASVLEQAAASLRRLDKVDPIAPVRRIKDAIAPPKTPFGRWRCTHAADWAQNSGFKIGEIYICRPDPSGNPRIYPYSSSFWAPYWLPDEGRFCYGPEDMEFKYLGQD